MRRLVLMAAAAVAGLFLAAPAGASTASVAALQVALHAHGLYPGPVDGVKGPVTKGAIVAFQQREGLIADGRIGAQTRRAFGPLGNPLLGQRALEVGAVGWDVSALEFRLIRWGLPPASVDGRFTPATATALIRLQSSAGLDPDGIAGPRTYRALAGGRSQTARSTVAAPQRITHIVRAGESFFSIAQRFHVSPWLLAKGNDLRLTGTIVPGQRLHLPVGATTTTPIGTPVTRDHVRVALNRWSRIYGVDPGLARALGWMESGWQQGVVSNVGAVGVMQLLPETWDWVDAILIGHPTPRTAAGNVQAGVRYLKWQLDQFDGNIRLALAGWYQGARAVREIGLYDDTKLFVKIVRMLYGKV
jgi:peptidoglycan hydrolase-like protein with peptidoglycan-binding domain